MDVRLFGELEVVSDDSAALPVKGAKQRALVALLALQRGEPVGADRLIEALWGDEPPGNPTNALQALVANVRRALGAGAVATSGAGYSLTIDPLDVDIVRFERLVLDGRSLLDAGDVDAASDALRAALELRTGEPLVEFAFAEFAQSDRNRLEELALVAIEGRIELDLAAGRHSEVVGELEALCAEHPLREHLWELRMVALYRAGRQADALRAYREARDGLIEELGIEPGPELRKLEAAILDHDPSLSPAVTPQPSRERHWNVPEPLTHLVGRDDDLRLLAERVGQHRLVTLVGPGGVGKTRLAVEVVRNHGPAMTHGAVVVELARAGDAYGMRGAIAAALDVRDPDRLPDLIGGRDVLVLLDNCEHVIDEAASLVRELLQRCPNLRLVATSREALRVEGEIVWPVAPLDRDSATQLFVERGTAASPHLSQAYGEADVADICARLDGLPLAIELAAARTRALPPGQMLERLDDRFRLLTSGARTAEPRQQTLRAVVDWSFDLLFEAERRVFERLSVFRGGCSFEAAEAVCSDADVDSTDVADLLSALVDKSLVIMQVDGGIVRYGLLQTLTDYGGGRLADKGESTEVRARHAAHYAALCDRSDDARRGVDQVSWFAEVRSELDNLRAALDWYVEVGDAENALHVAGSLGWFWWVTGRAAEGCQWIDTALSTSGEPSSSSSSKARAWALSWLAYLGYVVGRGADATLTVGEQAHALYLQVDDPHGFAYSCCQIALVTIALGESSRGGELLAESAALYEGLRGDEWGRAQHAFVRSYEVFRENDPHRREDLLRDAAAGFGSAGDLWGQALALLLLGEMRGVDGSDPVAGRIAFEQTLTIARTLGVASLEGIALARLGNAMVQEGDIAAAERLHDEAIAIGRRLAYPPLMALSQNSIAARLRRQGQLDEANAAAQEALELYRGVGHGTAPDGKVHMDAPEGAALALVMLGLVAGDRRELETAKEHHTRALAVAQRTIDPVVIAIALEGLARTAALRSEGAEAAMLLGHARALREAALTSYSTFEDDVAEARRTSLDLLGRDAYDAAFEQGHRSELGDVMSFSLYL